jgi:hypothetical protein
MGRGGRKTAGSDADAAGIRELSGRSCPYDPAARHTIALTDAVTHAVLGLENVNAYVGEINAKARTKAAGRGDKLIVAINDLTEAQNLARSMDPSHRRLARSMSSNAIWHLGRLAAKFDEHGELRKRVAEVIETHVVAHAPRQLQELYQAGLISDEQERELAPLAQDLCREAYLGTGASPRWAAVMTMHRAAQVLAELEAVRAPEGSSSEQSWQLARTDTQSWISKAQDYLSGAKPKLDYQLTKEAAGFLTRSESVAVALTDPESRQLNSALSTEMVQAHRDLVAESGRKPHDLPVLVVNDERWLAQVMNYQVHMARAVQSVDAVNSGPGGGIFFAPPTMEGLLADSEQGRVNNTLCHELVHAAQPAGVDGRSLGADHELLELQLLEGSTQSQANRLNRRADGLDRGLGTNPEVADIYAPWVAVVDVAAEIASPQDTDAFVARVSGSKRNARTKLLASALLGSEAAAPELVDLLTPITRQAEERWGCEADLAGLVREQLRAQLADVTASAVAA